MAEQLSTDKSLIRFDSREQAAEITAQLIDSANRVICFFGPDLDSSLLNHQPIADALSELARKSSKTLIRFLVHDTKKNISQRHRLITLAQRISSKIQIHIVSKEYQHSKKLFLLVDDDKYLFLANSQIYTGRAAFTASTTNRELQNEFDEIWAHSTPDPNTRRLGL